MNKWARFIRWAKSWQALIGLFTAVSAVGMGYLDLRTTDARIERKVDSVTTDLVKEAKDREKRYAKAFGGFIRHGIAGLPEEDRSLMQQQFRSIPTDADTRDLSAVSGAGGGFRVNASRRSRSPVSYLPSRSAVSASTRSVRYCTERRCAWQSSIAEMISSILSADVPAKLSSSSSLHPRRRSS